MSLGLGFPLDAGFGWVGVSVLEVGVVVLAYGLYGWGLFAFFG